MPLKLIDIRVDLWKFANLCRKQKRDNPAFPHGFNEELVKGFALASADQPFTWDRANKLFFSKVAGYIVQNNSRAYDDVIYLITEPRIVPEQEAFPPVTLH